MVINLGLKLEINPKLTGTQNLFLQLYGHEPQQDCSDEARELISQLVQQVKYSGRLNDFFSLEDNTPSMRGLSDDCLMEIVYGLDELRERFTIEILALFDSLPEEVDTTIALISTRLTSKANAQESAASATGEEMHYANCGLQLPYLDDNQESANLGSSQEPSSDPGTTLSEIKRQELYDTPTDFVFSAAIYRALTRTEPKIETIGDLVKLTPRELFVIPHIGSGAVIEILNYLIENGLSLSAPQEED